MIGCCEYQKLGNGEIPKRQRRGKYNQGRTIAAVYTKTCRMSLGCPTLHRGFEIEPESMKWIIQHTNANMVETGFFETCSTSYANSMALWIIL